MAPAGEMAVLVPVIKNLNRYRRSVVTGQCGNDESWRRPNLVFVACSSAPPLAPLYDPDSGYGFDIPGRGLVVKLGQGFAIEQDTHIARLKLVTVERALDQKFQLGTGAGFIHWHGRATEYLAMRLAVVRAAIWPRRVQCRVSYQCLACCARRHCSRK